MMQIAGREISGDEPALVIAEIGVNHDGSEARALELVELAARAGADAVKLQVFRADALMNSAAAFADYQQQRCTDASPIEMLRRYELPADALRRIVEQIRRRGMIPLATPFSLGDVEILRELELPAIKIASPDIVNTPLLARCAGLGRPLLISTGAATLEEIDAAVESVHSANIPFALLHCISSYPAPDESANLCWIGELMARYGVAIGYSDHTTNALAGAAAAAAGACIIEKHLTYDRDATGPDHSASADAAGFGQYVRLIREAQRLRGRGGKRVLSIEEDVRRVSRQSIALCRDVGAGEAITDSHLTVQRPGTGIPAAAWSDVVGRRAVAAVAAGTLLQWDMISCDAIAYDAA